MPPWGEAAEVEGQAVPAGATCSWARATSRALRSMSCWMPRRMARCGSSRSKVRVAVIWLAESRFSDALARRVSVSMLGLTENRLLGGCSVIASSSDGGR